MGQFLNGVTRPEDRILVWGFAPEVYHYAKRLPSSRHFVSNLLTGLVPWTNLDIEDTSYAIHPDAWNEFKNDLRHSPPALLVDLSLDPAFRYGKYPPEKYPFLWDYLQNNYRLLAPKPGISDSVRVWMHEDSYQKILKQGPSTPPPPQ